MLFQSMERSGFDGSSLPLTTVNAVATPRCVTGIPAYAGTAIADVIPGATSKGTPALASVSTSSPPLPNTNGSPPLRRTTVLPSRAALTSVSLIWAWKPDGVSGSFPMNTRSASGGASASNSGLMSLS